MLVLDTDHLAEIDRNSAIGQNLVRRLRTANEEAVTTIVSAEEQLRGWLALIARYRDPFQQIEPYSRLNGRLAFFAKWRLLPWDEAAAKQFKNLRKARVRIGTMDLRMASIVLANDALLLTRNFADFAQAEPAVRGLAVLKSRIIRSDAVFAPAGAGRHPRAIPGASRSL